MKTIMPKQIKSDQRKWYVIDAKWQTLGRLASKIAIFLKGKNKPDFAPYVDNGDYVVVINANKFNVTWKKLTDKIYYRHSWYLWWLKQISLEDMLVKKPLKALELAVSGMLPKNKLRKSMISRLKGFEWETHSFVAQKPTTIQL